MSIVHVSGSTGSGVPTDRTLFVGPKIPQEIKRMIKPLKQIENEKQKFRKLLQVTVMALEGEIVESNILKELEDATLSEESVCVIYSGLYKLLQLALRIPQSSLKPEIFQEDLQELNIPKEFIPDIASAVFGSRRTALDTHIQQSCPGLPKLQCFRWRVDVAISTSSLNRVLEPTVLMEMTLSDGSIRTFDVPVSKFHELRYNVSAVLKEMEDLEKRSILRILD